MAKEKCIFYIENGAHFLIEYRGDFKGQIDKVNYACGYIINDNLGIVAVQPENLEKLLDDVPAIIYVDFRTMYVTQDISPENVDNLQYMKSNKYLNLTGENVLIGLVDTGIDYLNEEFIREDGTSRILEIWDQSIESGTTEESHEFLGAIYSNEKINNAIKAHKNGEDPYKIVPSKDEVGHGTKSAGIIGARGYNKQFVGVAPKCDFIVIKLAVAERIKERLKEDGIENVAVYNIAHVVMALEYLKQALFKYKKPIVICLGVGTTEGSHDGNMLISRYLSAIGRIRGIALVAGVGNEGGNKGHVSGFIKNVGLVERVELSIPRELKYFALNIWVQKPNKASVAINSPTGESTNNISIVNDKPIKLKFYFVDTEVTVTYYSPERYTGHEVINITFKNIKAGIWQFDLKGEYIINGRYDIWLTPASTLPEGTEFLQPDPYNTLTVPSTGLGIITVTYLGERNTILTTPGKGFNTNGLINPDIATIGVDILTTQPSGGVAKMSGSSAATAIVAGVCALLLQWGIIDGNDKSMYSTKIRSYLIYGNYKNPMYKFPNKDIGYGELDLLETFNIISRSYGRNIRCLEDTKDSGIEYNIGNLFIRMPKEYGGFFK